MTFPHLSQAQVVMDAPTQVETRPFTKVLSLAALYFSVLVLLPPSPHSHALNVPSSKTLLKPLPPPHTWESTFPPFYTVTPYLSLQEQFKCHLLQEALLESVRKEQAFIEHLQCAGPRVRLWEVEMHQILAWPPGGRSDDAEGPWGRGWKAAEVESDKP